MNDETWAHGIVLLSPLVYKYVFSQNGMSAVPREEWHCFSHADTEKTEYFLSFADQGLRAYTILGLDEDADQALIDSRCRTLLDLFETDGNTKKIPGWSALDADDVTRFRKYYQTAIKWAQEKVSIENRSEYNSTIVGNYYGIRKQVKLPATPADYKELRDIIQNKYEGGFAKAYWDRRKTHWAKKFRTGIFGANKSRFELLRQIEEELSSFYKDPNHFTVKKLKKCLYKTKEIIAKTDPGCFSSELKEMCHHLTMQLEIFSAKTYDIPTPLPRSSKGDFIMVKNAIIAKFPDKLEKFYWERRNKHWTKKFRTGVFGASKERTGQIAAIQVVLESFYSKLNSSSFSELRGTLQATMKDINKQHIGERSVLYNMCEEIIKILDEYCNIRSLQDEDEHEPDYPSI